jgi:hypothetical protein
MSALRFRTVPLVTVTSHRGQFAVVATADIAAGQPLLLVDGPLVPAPDRYTVQVGTNEHVDGGPDANGELPVWRFLNHSCEPNTRLVFRTLVAKQPIRPGEEITFDYDTTEWDMDAPFPCACGSASCRGLVRGYRHLTPAQRAALTGVAPHLLAAVAKAR